LLQVITSFEEELEIIEVHDDTDGKKIIPKDKKKKEMLLPLEYLIALVIFILLMSVYLFVVQNHIDSTDHLPGTFNVSLKRS
jgi:hypothetical protein